MYQEVELDFATESDNPQILSRLKDHPAFLFRLPTILQATRGAYAGQSPATTNRGAAAQHLEFIFVFAAPRNLLGIRRTMTLSFSEKDWYSITLSTSGGPEYALYGTPFDKINSTYSTATTGGTVGIAATDTTDPSQQWQIVQYNASCHMLRTRSSIATAWLRMPTSNLNPSYEVMSLPVDMRSYAYQKSGDPMLWMIEDDGGSAGPNFVNSALRPYWIMQPESNGVGRVTLQFNPSTKWRYSFTRQDMITTYNFQQTTPNFTPEPIPNHISKGTTGGIGAGVVVVALFVSGISGFFWLKRRKSRRASNAFEEEATELEHKELHAEHPIETDGRPAAAELNTGPVRTELEVPTAELATDARV